jgi:hypothetical protein
MGGKEQRIGLATAGVKNCRQPSPSARQNYSPLLPQTIIVQPHHSFSLPPTPRSLLLAGPETFTVPCYLFLESRNPSSLPHCLPTFLLHRYRGEGKEISISCAFFFSCPLQHLYFLGKVLMWVFSTFIFCFSGVSDPYDVTISARGPAGSWSMRTCSGAPSGLLVKFHYPV